MNKRGRQAGAIGASLIALLLTGVAGAKPAEQTPEAKRLDPGRQQQDAALEAEVGDLTKAGSRVKDAQTRAEKAGSRAQELETQWQDLQEDLRTRQEAATEPRDQRENAARGAYKGEDSNNISVVAGQVLQGKDANAGSTAAGQAARVSIRSRVS